MRQFDEIEYDALKEIFNIGIGHAADSFSQMIGSPVLLSVPALELLFGDGAIQQLRTLDSGLGSMITQRFEGGFTADGVLVFPGERSLELVRLMVGTEVPISEMRELEQDALVEVGNILFNSSISVISDMIGESFQCSMPRFESGHIGQFLTDFHESNECLLLMNIAFTVEQVQVQGFVMFLMKIDSVEIFIKAVKRYMGLV